MLKLKNMTGLLVAISCLTLFSKGFAQEEQLKQLLFDTNIEVSESARGGSGTFWVNKYVSSKSETINDSEPSSLYSQCIGSRLVFSVSEFRPCEEVVCKGQTFVAYVVEVCFSGGFSFHVADYSDGTRIVTCLDGPMLGHQGIAFNGVQIGGSTKVTWFANYFVHSYPTGKVVSYENKQIIEIY